MGFATKIYKIVGNGRRLQTLKSATTEQLKKALTKNERQCGSSNIMVEIMIELMK